jgi:NADPH:quinone reductase-like Zn-dependent oxidoreductase
VDGRARHGAPSQCGDWIRGDLPIGPDLPAFRGCDVAGIVEEVGAGVLGFAPTDAVLGGIEAVTSSLAETIALIRDIGA